MKTKRKMQTEHFFPRIQMKAKKKRFSPKIEHFFSPVLGEDLKIKTKRSSPKRELFLSPILGEEQKKQNKIKKVFSKDRTLFLPDFR